MNEPTQINGACHCGNIRFVLRWPAAIVEIPRRECGCSFCQKHGGAWTSHPESGVSITITDESLVSRYNFGTRTADFIVCSSCGVVPVVVCEIGEHQYAVVNVNTFEDTPGLTLSTSSTNFEGEDTGSRLERRQRNWIPDVQFSAD